MKKKSRTLAISQTASADYGGLIGGIAELLETARRTAARTVNALMTATYWEIGRRIVEFEQSGKKRAEYGEEVLARLADDLTSRFGRGFSRRNLQSMRQFYTSFPLARICPDTVWTIRRTASSFGKFGKRLSASVVALRPPDHPRPLARSL